MKILLPTDFSENSLKSIDYAIYIFGIQEVQYHLLHTFEIISTRASVSFGGLKNQIEKQADENLCNLNNDIIQKYPSIQISQQHQYGALSDIINTLEKDSFDYIIMGTKGSTGLKEVFLGSNTWDVISNTSIPVIAVPQEVDFKQNKKLLFALDPYKLPSQKVIQSLLKIEKKKHFEILLFAVKNKENFDVNEINELFKGIEFKLIIVENEDVVNSIETYQQQNQIDLLVMVNQQRSFWENLFHSSITKKLTFHTKSPLLTFKD